MVAPKKEEKVALLTEALLEIRFKPSIKDIALIVGGLSNTLKEYPSLVNLNVPDFPNPEQFPELNKIARYRFFSEDKKNLYNIGKGVLSINTLNYPGFTKFIKNIEKVLEEHKKVSEITTITRIGLRYINKISNKVAGLEDFNIKVDVPSSLHDINTGFILQMAGKVDKDILITRFNSESPLTKEMMILDFDYYSETEQNYDIKKILSWVDFAHKNIYKSFTDSISEKILKLI